MKLLLDQNLSRRLLPDLLPQFPGSSQVQLLGFDTATDAALWDFAKANGYAIVTKDVDFVELMLLRRVPAKDRVAQLRQRFERGRAGSSRFAGAGDPRVPGDAGRGRTAN